MTSTSSAERAVLYSFFEGAHLISYSNQWKFLNVAACDYVICSFGRIELQAIVGLVKSFSSVASERTGLFKLNTKRQSFGEQIVFKQNKTPFCNEKGEGEKWKRLDHVSAILNLI